MWEFLGNRQTDGNGYLGYQKTYHGNNSETCLEALPEGGLEGATDAGSDTEAWSALSVTVTGTHFLGFPEPVFSDSKTCFSISGSDRFFGLFFPILASGFRFMPTLCNNLFCRLFVCVSVYVSVYGFGCVSYRYSGHSGVGFLGLFSARLRHDVPLCDVGVGFSVFVFKTVWKNEKNHEKTVKKFQFFHDFGFYKWYRVVNTV